MRFAALVLVFLPALATALPAKRKAERSLRLIAVGDLMLGTSVQRLISVRDPGRPFSGFRTLLRGADVTFGNLETPLSSRGEATRGKSTQSLKEHTNFIFRAPPLAAKGLASAGFDIVSVANNHTADYGPIALLDTLAHLRAVGVRPIGAGADLDAAMAPVYLSRRGSRLAFFGLSDVLPPCSAADAGAPGIAPARGAAFEKRMPAAIAAARKRADWVLVSVHWGRERFAGATAKQRRLGHRLIDWGADVVIGHHTHCLGPVERYRTGIIHYSLGNFIQVKRTDVAAWEVTLEPGKAPRERLLRFRWNGKRLVGQAGERQGRR